MNDILDIFDPYPDKRSIKNSLIYEKLNTEGLVIKINRRKIKQIKEQSYKIYDLAKGMVNYYHYTIICDESFSHNFYIDIVKDFKKENDIFYYKNFVLNVENVDYYLNNELLDLDFFSLNYRQCLLTIDFDRLTTVSFYSYKKIDLNDIEIKLCLKKPDVNVDLLFLNNSLEYLSAIKKDIEKIIENKRFIIYNEFDYYKMNFSVKHLNNVGLTSNFIEESYSKIYQNSYIKDMFYITQLKLSVCMYYNVIKNYSDILSDYNNYVEHEEKIINQLLNKKCIEL